VKLVHSPAEAEAVERVLAVWQAVLIHLQEMRAHRH
jgi:hypothetical protein